MATQQKKAAMDIFPAKLIRQICLEAGADEVGFVEIDRPELAQERQGILENYPATQTIISLSRALNRENVQSPARPLYNGEVRRTEEDLSRISGEIMRHLNSQDIRGVILNPAFPMDMNRWPGKTWDVSHKTMAVEAGIGVMGLNRLVLSPRFGSNIFLNSILINAQVDPYDQRLEQNPCLNCRLCAAVCPTGAVQKDGAFDFLACATHSYRDLSGGFDWAAALLTSGDLGEYRAQFQDRETMGLWQSLLFGFNHKCGYCQAVCPVGDVGMPRYLADKKGYFQELVKPLKERAEPVYVLPGSQAESRVKSNSHKEIRYAKLARPLQ
ncbi:MAG: 4Fe-4S ferredoxin [Syntrophales bacterium]|nr:4Fe-4S ferredoxin [Syntrophales bacterium]MDD5640007.1 4Fe-4S ferredoxin [Syntrophales bacterium]